MFPENIRKLIANFNSLPGIGNKMAERLVFYLLSLPTGERQNFSDNLSHLTDGLYTCSKCFGFATSDHCSICSDKTRNADKLCVVSDTRDIEIIESIGQFRGLYHVLGGVLNPLDGISPDRLKIKELEARVAVTPQVVTEVILALSPDIAGESTILYLTKLLGAYHVMISRLAQGLPAGAELEYTDPITLSRAFKGRVGL